MLYDNPFTISLENFAHHCNLPFWGSLNEPPHAEYESFLTSLSYGERRGVTQGRIKSIHFPAIQYFALFNGKCIVGKQDCSTLCAPDLSLIHTALTGEKSYNLGAIVARRLQHNANSGYFYGGIYATRLAQGLGVSPLPFDPILPMQYLDFDILKAIRSSQEKFIISRTICCLTKNPLCTHICLRLLFLTITAKEDILFLRARPEPAMRQWRQHGKPRHPHREPP